MRWLAIMLICSLSALADTIFLEAETFTPSDDGWRVMNAIQPHLTSGKVLAGSTGNPEGTAMAMLTITEPGPHRVWVRYSYHATWRGPFQITARQDDTVLGTQSFDTRALPGTANFAMVWRSFEVELPVGEVSLTLSKEPPKACSGWTRAIDCLVVTDNLSDDPPHQADFGPKVWLRAEVLEGYERPVQIHLYTPFVGHHYLARDGLGEGTGPQPDRRLSVGESSGWCDITRLLYPRLAVGARHHINARYSYADVAPRLHVKLDLATAPQDDAIVRTLIIDYTPGTLYLTLPQDLSTPENIERIVVDKELAQATGALADAHEWPTFGQAPRRFPYFSGASLPDYGDFAADASIIARERATLAHFGFSDGLWDHIGGGAWRMKENSMWLPDRDAMRHWVAHAKAQRGDSIDLDKVVFCKLMDEPWTPTMDQLTQTQSAVAPIRAWLEELGVGPLDLGLMDWEDVRPVGANDRDAQPELYVFTQRFRAVVLSRFLAMQREVITEVYGRELRCMGNFSDLALYTGNFFTGAADYFELMRAAPQNALWSGCGGAFASTPQLTNYNTDLLRGAARGMDVQLGHYLMVYGRRPWDFQAKAIGHLARDVRALKNYFYGPTWANYEGGPPWQTGAWYAHPDLWTPNADLVRLIGGAEELLMDARRAPARVALIYNQSTDIWTLNENHAYGFDRMHLWLALTHAQIPVDIVDATQVSHGVLADYDVAYLTGPNLAAEAATALTRWVNEGGTLVLSAGAGQRDAFNQPLNTLTALAPGGAAEAEVLAPFKNYGKAIRLLKPADEVTSGTASLQVLSIKQALTPQSGATVIGSFADGSPGLVQGAVGKGRVWQYGCLPGLSYIYPALVAQHEVPLPTEASVDALPEATEDVSIAPKEFPTAIRELLLRPVRDAGVDVPVICDQPLVDVGYLTSDAGIVVTLANWTLRPLDALTLAIDLPATITSAESVRHGKLPLAAREDGRRMVTLPLESTDILLLRD